MAGKRRTHQHGKNPHQHQQQNGSEQQPQESKRQERQTREALRQERIGRNDSYLDDDDNFASFSNQLKVLGLQLRDIAGDGNCLFRSLADQLDGHSRVHNMHRQQTAEFMEKHRSDFEPFIEDDIPFDKYLTNLRQPGMYAGNDAIVAFCRHNQVNAVIHQLNAPLWKIQGTEKPNARELHISYHNGDHYCSVRRIGDTSNDPTNIRLKSQIDSSAKHGTKPKQKAKPSSPQGFGQQQQEGGLASDNNLWCFEDEEVDRIQRVMDHTGCQDVNLVRQTLEENDFETETTINLLLTVMCSGPAAPDPSPADACSSSASTKKPTSSKSREEATSSLWDEQGTGTRLFGRDPQHSSQQNKPASKKKTQQSHMSNSRRKQLAKQERKQRSEDRRKQGAMGGNNNNNNNNQTDSDSDGSNNDSAYVLTKNIGMLAI